MLSGNGSLLLFRTQAVNAGGASSPATRLGRRRRHRRRQVDDRRGARRRPPTRRRRPTCRRRRRPAAPRTRRRAATATRPATRSNPIPGPARASRKSELDETPPDARRHAVHRRRCHPTPARPTGGAIVDIQGANFVGRPDDGAVERRFIGYTFVNSALLRVTAPPSAGGSTVRSPCASSSTGEASNEVQYHLRGRPDRAVDHVVQPDEHGDDRRRRAADDHRRRLQQPERPVRAQRRQRRPASTPTRSR